MKKSVIRFLFLILLSGIFCTCQDDSDSKEELTGKNEDLYLTLTLRVPGINSTLKGLGDIEENHIETVDVIAFVEDNGVEKYIYHTHATDINNSGGSVNEKEFRAMLVKSPGNKPQRIVILANLREEIDNVKNNFLTTMTKEEILKEITFFSSDVWNTTSPDDFRPLPMWGESESTFVLTDNTTSDDIGKIYMIRSIARVDVGIKINANGDPEGLGDLFKISDIKLYNTNSSGTAAPHMANYDNQNKKVTAPSLPESVTPNPVLGHELTPPGDGLMRSIYISEADNIQVGAHEDITCLVIGGYYNYATNKSWYRIDFLDKSVNDGTLLNILRNHRYRVNITSVDGPGYDDEDTAFRSKSVNMNTEIVAWDEGDLNEIVFDGQYQLSVNTSEIRVPKEGFAKPLRIFTDYASWIIIDKPSWVTLTEDNGIGGVMKEVGVGAQPSDVERTGEMYIKAGRLKKKITIVQTLDSEFSFEVDPLFLEFGKTPQTAKTITVTTMPANLERTFTIKPGGDNIDWITFPADGLSETVYNFRPGTNTTGSILEATVIVTVMNGATPVSKEVVIRQTAYEVIFGATPNNKYPVEGGSNLTFTVGSNVDWMVTSAEAAAGMINIATNVLQTPSITSYNFNLTPNNTFADRIAKVNFGSPDPDFPSAYSIDIIQDHNDPMINTFNPTSINFGESSAAQTVTFNTNAEWSFTTNTGYANVVASSQPAVGSVQPGGTPSTPVSKQVVFYPAQSQPATGLPAAGNPYNGVATFSTQNHAGATAATYALTLTRTVPSFFNGVTVKSPTGNTIAKAGGNVTVEVSTNDAWSIRASTGATKSQTASSYNKKNLVVAVPQNNGAAREVSIFYTYKGNEILLKTFTQEGGNVVTGWSGDIPDPLPSDGKNCSLQFTGTFQNLKVKATKGTATGTVLAEGTVPGGSVPLVLKVPGNFTLTSYNVVFQYEDVNGWQTFKIASHPSTNYALSNGTGRVVARENLSSMQSWVNALGIDTSYGNVRFGASAEYNATRDTGCNAYYEGSASDPVTGKGCWKVPSWNELGAMKSVLQKLNMPTNREYWSTDENISNYTNARGYDFTNSFNSYSLKSTLYYVRCVRKNPNK